MREQTAATKARAILARHNLHPKKALGQNFLLARGVTEKIVAAAGIAPGDVVVEIGPGLGVLTRALAEAGARVLAVELDRTLLPVLEETLQGLAGVELLHADALQLDYAAVLRERHLAPPFKVVANLPYYITSPLIAKFLENEPRPAVMVLMMQKEVAERLVAAPGTKDYGALSVLVQFYTEPRVVCRVAPGNFFPPPKVHSAVVRLNLRDRPAVEVADAAAFFRLVRAAFSQRRKMLPKALEAAGLGLAKQQWAALAETAGIDPARRGETLTLDEFARLADAWAELQHGEELL
ncbi:MAG: 16S rRNA (adenine(1518)-N(6)/adenine(1519)-N(6))-dimethyltransferase RsmA [Bacillota bacterium]